MNINKKIQALSHSGATLGIIKDENDDFVVSKKISENIDRNVTALAKQQRFRSITTSCYQVSAIPINSINKIDDVLVIKMPYIDGIGGEQFAIHGNRQSAYNLKITLNTYLIDLWSKSKVKDIDPEIIHDKVNHIESIEYDDIISDSVSSGCELIRKLCTKKLSIPIAECHGDLTLSNMIVSLDKLYIFDFLDSIIESPLQDAAKVIQDMKYGWSFRKSKPSIKLKGQLFCESAYPDFINTIELLYPREMKVIEMLTILRIAPYISKEDEITKLWFNKAVLKCLEEANK